jgi:3-oxoacyl-[acyl-carrier protein] reductase
MKAHEIKAVITGGTAGIGLAMAKVIIAAGGKAAVCGRNPDRVKALNDAGIPAFVADVTSESQMREFLSAVVSEWGAYNVLVNNAAYGHFAPLTELRTEDFEALLKVDVLGAMICGQLAARYFIEQGGGNIVNISSTAGLSGFPGGTAYVAAKFALRGMTECWRAELRKHHVRVMLINPSEVQTTFYINSGLGDRPHNPTKLQADDIAHTLLSMLLMDDRGFITEATVFATNPQNV